MSLVRSTLFGCALLLTPALSPLAAPACPSTPPTAPMALPHLLSAVSHGVEGLIVALGSSSTQGAMASDLAHSYPAVLQQALSAALPEAHVAVINRGIGGQDATEEVARLDADVLAVRPQLVIWQVGANGALRNADPAVFRSTVAAGVRRLQAAGADVILMDNQQSPALLARASEPEFDHELAGVARDTGAALFSRRALMQAWSHEGAPLVQFIASDGLHHNNHGYQCIAQSLASAVVDALTPAPPLTASR
ncbi:MAG TPA: GDSL-type esterase/lipase family protein [Acetobacteraceae bacterium]|nr:GDSL-type esterase/lipase family protein [Acetobacteraceae bacterium]